MSGSRGKPNPKWVKGMPSPNPEGGRRYSKERRELITAVRAAAPEIISKLIDQAKGGDVQAARLLFDKAYPNLKAVSLPVKLEDADQAASMTQKAELVINNAMNGTIYPEIAAELLQSIADVTRIREADEIIKRIEELERRKP